MRILQIRPTPAIALASLWRVYGWQLHNPLLITTAKRHVMHKPHLISPVKSWKAEPLGTFLVLGAAMLKAGNVLVVLIATFIR